MRPFVYRPLLPKPPRVDKREIFVGTLRQQAGATWLVINTGAWVVETDKDGATISDKKSGSARLWQSPGDRLVLSDRDVEKWDAVCLVQIIGARAEGWTQHNKIIALGERVDVLELPSVFVQPVDKKIRSAA